MAVFRFAGRCRQLRRENIATHAIKLKIQRSGQTWEDRRGLLRILRVLRDLGLNFVYVYNSRLHDCAEVTQVVTFVRNNFAHDATHDLSRACLGRSWTM